MRERKRERARERKIHFEHLEEHVCEHLHEHLHERLCDHLCEHLLRTHLFINTDATAARVARRATAGAGAPLRAFDARPRR